MSHRPVPLLSAVLCALFLPGCLATELLISGKGELYVADVPSQTTINRNWFDGGTGQLAYPTHAVAAGPQYLSVEAITDNAFSAKLNAQWHRQPEAGFGITEAWLNWAPLPMAGYRFRGRLGYFYPQLSLENTDTAWTSPYSSSFSAINSWVAEEVKARGAELSISRPGRFFQSAHSWTLVGGLFQGNDPAGTILAWRGFALHNLQSGLGERVDFANYPSLRQEPLTQQPSWVEPTRELDHRTGYYVGAHWQYQQRSQIRAYYYDNNGDPLVFRQQQYAWRTRFASVAAQQVINDQWQVVAQWLQGSTLMGPAVVDIDFNAWFLLASWQQDAYSATLRYDHFTIDDNDHTLTDDNNGTGNAVLLALGYRFNDNISVSAEHIRLNSEQQNRAQQWPWPAKQQQSITKLVLSWRWH